MHSDIKSHPLFPPYASRLTEEPDAVGNEAGTIPNNFILVTSTWLEHKAIGEIDVRAKVHARGTEQSH